MRQLKTEITINAPAKTVWDILMNFDKYPEWNPMIKSVTGKVEKGSQITVELALEGQKPQTFRPNVLKREEGKEFRWIGHLFFTGLFDGEHYFVLEDAGDNQTKLTHGENFKGILVGLIMGMIGEKTEQAFKAMNEALKQRAEA